MSTAYPPRLIKYAFTSKKERDAARTTTMDRGFYGNFPPLFGLYSIGPGTDFLSQNMCLAPVSREDPAAVPKAFYAITFHKGPGTRQMTLYASPEHSGSPLAVATNEKRYSNNLVVTLPAESGGGPPRTEVLKHTGVGAGSRTFEFGGEKFEWRDSGTKPRVRKLLLLGTASSRKNSSSAEAKVDATADKLIATWTEGTIPNRQGRLALFEFHGNFSGSSVAGETEHEQYWTLLAVSSVIACCQHGPAVDGTMDWQKEKNIERIGATRESKGGPGGYRPWEIRNTKGELM